MNSKIYNLFQYFYVKEKNLYQKMLNTDHNDLENKRLCKWHLEGSVWTHTLMVVNYLIKNNADIETILAGLLHDIGKVYTRKLGKDNENTAKFYGHENYSTVYSVRILKNIKREIFPEINVINILKLINNHSFFHKIGKFQNEEYILSSKEKREINRKFAKELELYEKQILLSEADIYGRINYTYNKNENKKFTFFKNYIPYVGEEKTINKKNSPKLIMLCGLPGTGKSKYIKENFNLNDYILISSDEYIENKSKNFNYDEKFSNISSKEFSKIEFELQNKIKEAVKNKKNIIIDRTNLSKKTRNKWNNFIPYKYYYKECYFLINNLEIILNRNKNRKNKNIPEEIIKKMIRNFKLPDYTEEWDNINIKIY